MRDCRAKYELRIGFGFEFDCAVRWIEGYQLAFPELVVWNENKPGVIGSIGTVLGRRNLNVSSVHLGLNPVTNEAVSLWNLDTPLTEEAAAEIRKAPNVGKAVALSLG